MFLNLVKMFSRGSEVTFHALEMTKVAFLRVFAITFFTSLGLAALATWWHLGHDQSRIVIELIIWRLRALLDDNFLLALPPNLGDGRTDFYVLRFFSLCATLIAPFIFFLTSVMLVLRGLSLYESTKRSGKVLVDLTSQSADEADVIALINRRFRMVLVFGIASTFIVALVAGEHRHLLPLHMYLGLAEWYPGLLWFIDGSPDAPNFIWLGSTPFQGGWYQIDRVQEIFDTMFGPQRTYIFIWAASFVVFIVFSYLYRLYSHRQIEESSDYSLAQLTVPTEDMHLPIFICGSLSSGRNLAIKEIIDGIRERGEKAIIYDSGSGIFEHYYRDEYDFLLSPTDQRAVPWSVWGEAENTRVLNELADSLFPRGERDSQEAFYQENAARLFADIAHRTSEERKTSKIVERLSGAFDGQALHSFLDDSFEPCSSLGILKDQSIALRVISKASMVARAFAPLRDVPSGETEFSTQKYILGDSSDRCAFIRSGPENDHTFRPLLSLWSDLFARALLKLPISHQTPHWFILDSIESLQRMPNLRGLLERGWAHNVRVVVVLGNMQEFEDCYGQVNSQGIVLQGKNWVIFRCDDPMLARHMERRLGDEEVREANESYSMGVNSIRDGVNVEYLEIRRPIVPAATLQTLENDRSYIILNGKEEIYNVKFEREDD